MGDEGFSRSDGKLDCELRSMGGLPRLPEIADSYLTPVKPGDALDDDRSQTQGNLGVAPFPVRREAS